MRLFEAIIDANHRAAAGDGSAGLRPAEYADSLPIAALTCIDPRLNPLIPNVLGIPEDQFIWRTEYQRDREQGRSIEHLQQENRELKLYLATLVKLLVAKGVLNASEVEATVRAIETEK